MRRTEGEPKRTRRSQLAHSFTGGIDPDSRTGKVLKAFSGGRLPVTDSPVQALSDETVAERVSKISELSRELHMRHGRALDDFGPVASLMLKGMSEQDALARFGVGVQFTRDMVDRRQIPTVEAANPTEISEVAQIEPATEIVVIDSADKTSDQPPAKPVVRSTTVHATSRALRLGTLEHSIALGEERLQLAVDAHAQQEVVKAIAARIGRDRQRLEGLRSEEQGDGAFTIEADQPQDTHREVHDPAAQQTTEVTFIDNRGEQKQLFSTQDRESLDGDDRDER
jgi:hypothetical protein